jgi:chromosome segregation ATPase
MKKAFVVLVVLLLIGTIVYLALNPRKPAVQAPPPPPKEWTPEAIAADPEGYLTWSDEQIRIQIDERNKHLAALASRTAQIVERQKKLSDNLQDLQNIHDRLERAYRKAEEEDRWPVRMGGRSFERAKARAIIEQTAQYLEDRRPLLKEYDAAVAKMSASAAALKQDISSLHRLRERLALDVERIHLKEGMAELDAMRKTHAELAAMSKTLSSMTEDTSDLLKDVPASPTVDVESLLN